MKRYFSSDYIRSLKCRVHLLCLFYAFTQNPIFPYHSDSNNNNTSNNGNTSTNHAAAATTTTTSSLLGDGVPSLDGKFSKFTKYITEIQMDAYIFPELIMIKLRIFWFLKKMSKEKVRIDKKIKNLTSMPRGGDL